jgi:hypothetical protein
MDAAASFGYRFPSDPATPAQQREWQKIISGYVRRIALKQHQEFNVATLASAIGLQPRQTQTLLKEVQDPGRDDETLELAKEILHGMLTGKIAGVLGTEHNDETRAVFKLVRLACGADVGPEDAREFSILMSAFNVDYEPWKLERQPWHYKLNGEPRARKSRGTGSKQTG